MFTLIWVTGSVIVSLLFWRRPAVLLSAIVLARLIIPGVAQGRIMPVFHPAEALLLIHLCVQLLFAWPQTVRALSAARGVTCVSVIILLFSSVDLLSDQSSVGGVAASGFRVIVFPALLFLLIRDEVFRHGERSLGIFIYPIIAMGLVQVYLGEVQVTTGRSIVWSQYYRLFWWFNEGDVGRGMGTIGHYIQYGGFLATIIPLTLWIKWPLVRLPVAFLLVYGVLVSGSRVPLIMALIALSVVILFTFLRNPVQTIILGIVAGGSAASVFLSEAGVRMLARFQDGRVSNGLRLEAYWWFFERWRDFIWTGYPGARDLRGTGILGSSLENGYLIFGMSAGLALSGVLLILHAVLALGSYGRLASRPGLGVGLMIAAGMNVVFGFASSSFATGGTEVFLLMFVAGLGWGLRARTASGQDIWLGWC